MSIYPAVIQTIEQMRDVLANGTVRVFSVEVKATKVNGESVSVDHRGRAGDITYDLRPIDTEELFSPEQLTGIKPKNRRTDNAAIWAAKRGDVMLLIRYNENAINAQEMEYHLYALTEYPAYVNCQGEWIDDATETG